MRYALLLDHVIETYFEKAKFDLKGKLEWDAVTDRQKERYFKKKGKELTVQRVNYSTVEVFWEKAKDENKSTSPFLFYHHILISAIEEGGVFYCINDYCWARMGQKTRYKFKIENPQFVSNNEEPIIELLDKIMLMIR